MEDEDLHTWVLVGVGGGWFEVNIGFRAGYYLRRARIEAATNLQLKAL